MATPPIRLPAFPVALPAGTPAVDGDLVEIGGRHVELLAGRYCPVAVQRITGGRGGRGAVGAATVSCRQVRDRPAIGRRCPELSVDLVSGYVFEKRCGSR